MTMARHNLVVQDEDGNIIDGASVEVRHETVGQPLATLKPNRDGSGTLSNSFVASNGADVGFHVAGGVYQVRVYTGPTGAPTFERIWRYVAIGLGAETDSQGDLLSANNLSDLSAKYTAKDNLSVHGADVASASTINLEAATGDLIDVTGTTTVTAITLSEGHERTVRTTGILILTHGSSLVLPGGSNITTAAGDFFVFRGYAAGVVRCVGYSPIAGRALLAPNNLSDLASAQTARGNLGIAQPPQGRLTLQTGVPVMTTTQSAKTTIYYTPFVGNQIPLYDGTKFTPSVFSEISVATTDTAKNPAAIGANKVNDWFVWSDAGTLRLTHGPDWTTDTARSAGTALTMVNGILLNNASITNGPAASRGTYVGTTRSNGSSQLDWIIGGSASGGAAAFLYVWNAYNRRKAIGATTDSGTAYTYTSGTVRQARADADNQVNFVVGLQEDTATCIYNYRSQTAAVSTAAMGMGIGYDSSSTYVTAHDVFSNQAGNAYGTGASKTYEAQSAIGVHLFTALENSDGSNANTFDHGANNTLSVSLPM